jgi:hypothetical protein
MLRLASAVALLVAASACSSGGGHRGDASTDAIIDVYLPWPDGCPSGVSNEKGVGTPCTRGGGQCKSPLLCTCDPLLGAQLAGVPCFCTLAAFAQNGSKDPCKDSVPDPANYCGSGATCCDVLTSGAYCTPNVCLINDACLIFVPRDGGT